MANDFFAAGAELDAVDPSGHSCHRYAGSCVICAAWWPRLIGLACQAHRHLLEEVDDRFASAAGDGSAPSRHLVEQVPAENGQPACSLPCGARHSPAMSSRGTATARCAVAAPGCSDAGWRTAIDQRLLRSTPTVRCAAPSVASPMHTCYVRRRRPSDRYLHSTSTPRGG